MTTPFSSIEARINKTILDKTSNATASFGGKDVIGVFDKEPNLDVGIVSNALTFTYLAGSFQTDPDEGQIVKIDGVDHLMSGPPEYDRGYIILRLFEQ